MIRTLHPMYPVLSLSIPAGNMRNKQLSSSYTNTLHIVSIHATFLITKCFLGNVTTRVTLKLYLRVIFHQRWRHAPSLLSEAGSPLTKRLFYQALLHIISYKKLDPSSCPSHQALSTPAISGLGTKTRNIPIRHRKATSPIQQLIRTTENALKGPVNLHVSLRIYFVSHKVAQDTYASCLKIRHQSVGNLFAEDAKPPQVGKRRQMFAHRFPSI
ncbi:hypothetical protein BKA63DRAFT_206648 [Paraphoma chrysanthemicola]|nr:hypothetical protein BKA63DRAFT_206648 [Paraphoma chrysanthemicola]